MPRGLASMSLSDLQRELNRRRRSVDTLERRRAKLLKKLAALDAEIAASGGSGGRTWSRGAGGGRTRPRNEAGLLESLAKVLKGKTLGVSEAADAVRKAGYQTTSPNFRTMVNAQLLNKKMFRRVERGRYTAV